MLSLAKSAFSGNWTEQPIWKLLKQNRHLRHWTESRSIAQSKSRSAVSSETTRIVLQIVTHTFAVQTAVGSNCIVFFCFFVTIILQIMHGRISSIQANTRIQTKEMLIINYHQCASSLGPHSWRQIRIAENGVLEEGHSTLQQHQEKRWLVSCGTRHQASDTCRICTFVNIEYDTWLLLVRNKPKITLFLYVAVDISFQIYNNNEVLNKGH